MPVARRSSSRQACWHDVVADSHVSTAELTARFGPAVTALVQAVTDHACLGSYRQRKLVLREQVHGAGADAALLFAANKIAKVRELPDQIRRDRARFGETRADYARAITCSATSRYASSITRRVW